MNATLETPRRFCKSGLVLLLLLAVGFLLRLPGLGRDLWYDEASSLFNARGADALTTRIIPNGPEFTSDLFIQDGGWGGLLLAVSHAEYTPPLYFLLLRLWIKLLGESNRTLRSLSVIFGLGTILGIFFLGRKVFDDRIGLAAAGVLAVLPSHIQYSQEVRAYALSVLLVTLASWAFWSAYQRVSQRGGWKYWLLYIGLAAVSLYTHYFTVGIFLAHGLFALIQPRSLRPALVKRQVLVAAVILLLLLPWLLSSYSTTQVRMFQHQKIDPSMQGPGFWEMETIKRMAALICYLAAGSLPGVTFKSVLGLILFGLYALGGFMAVSIVRTREKQSVVFASLLLSAPLLLMISIAGAADNSGIFLFLRFALPTIIGLCLLFGAAIISSPHRALSFLMVGMIMAIALHFQVQWQRLSSNPSPLPGYQWFYGNLSLAVTRLNQQANPDELILFDDPLLGPTWNVYQRRPLPQLFMGRMSFYMNDPRDFEARWREVESKYAGVYFVRRAGMPPSEVLQRLETHYRLLSDERVGKLEIRHYIKPINANGITSGRIHRM